MIELCLLLDRRVTRNFSFMCKVVFYSLYIWQALYPIYQNINSMQEDILQRADWMYHLKSGLGQEGITNSTEFKS